MSDIYSVKIEMGASLMTPYTSGNSPEITQLHNSDLTINTQWNIYDLNGGTQWLKKLEFPLQHNTSTGLVKACCIPGAQGSKVWRFLWGIFSTMREHGLDEVVAKIVE